MIVNKNESRDTFIRLCQEHIKRDGIQDLLGWLETTDFYDAPASTKYHLMCEGGLCQHSINVFNRLIKEYGEEKEFTIKALESIAIVALFHDLCKVNFYTISTRNVKNEYGEWTKVPYYTVENKSDLVGHGHKSARIVSKFLDISDEEYMAILYHMGYSDYTLEQVSEIFGKNELALLLHVADTKATFIDEKEN